MIKARIAYLEEPNRLIFKEEELSPDFLKEGHVLCETLVSAISPGTELSAYEGASPLRPEVVYPRLVGYCNVARVLHCSRGVRSLRAGDRILSFSSHRSHFAIPSDDVLAVLDDDICSEDAACAYLFHLGYNAVLRGDVRLGSNVVVLGLGVLGLTSVAMAARAGARVFAISDHSRPRECALAMGAVACYGRARQGQLLEVLGKDRAHVVVTTSSAWEDWHIALECAGNQGTIVVLGFPGRQAAQIPFNPFDSAHFYARQLRIVAAGMSPERPDGRGFLPFNERDNLLRILGWFKDDTLRPSLLVSGEFAGDDLAIAYAQLLRREGSPITYLLRWGS